MDWWLRGRIIYTYSLWVVFKAAAVGGIFGEYSHVRSIYYFLLLLFYFSVPLTPLPFAVRQKDSPHDNPMA